MKKIIFFFIVLASFQSYSQSAQQFAKQADIHFKNADYIEAIRVYNAALKKNPNYVKAKYQLAECYRITFDYESAQGYYGEIALAGSRNFPLAGFYYASMQKLKGQYNNALTTFQLFQKFMQAEGLNDDEKYRSFYSQAKVEIDGCQLALNQISIKQPDYAFAPIMGELNSEYNDYAAFSIGSDDIVCVTSGRKGGKGGTQNSTFGETPVDLLRFRRNFSGEWEEYDLKDRFESMINTKWGDGSGSFNRERNKFYYTKCNGDLGDDCHIFVSNLEGGRWAEPKSLNRNINQVGNNSQHPNLTPGGDTLFFVSNRKGTLGGNDIWMSINAGDDNWSEAVNLGKQINTPFNDISPFYSYQEKILFFASDGHRGFGGLDIYIAKGKSLKEAEIYNAGMPFNSSRDDMFFFLGDEKGYLSSNREGGPGKLDIYEFDIESKDDVISDVATSATIAGRNSLYTDDYNFDSPETDVINQIISRRLSSSFSQVAVYLTTEQLDVYNSLSQTDKDRIDRIVNGRIRKMTSSSLRSIRSEDDYYYQQLDAGKRKKVDRVVTSYLEEQGLGLSISLSAESKKFYNNENPNDRERLDILVSERLSTSANYKPKSINYDKLSDKEKLSVDGIATKYLSQRKSIAGIKLTVAERVFMRDNAAEKAVTVNAAIKEKLLEMSRDEKYELAFDDNMFYEELTGTQKQSLKNLATTFLVSDLNTFDQKADQAEISALNRLGADANKRVDKLILKLVSNLASADAYRAETLFETGELLSANSGSADETLDKLFSLDRGMSEGDKEAIERFVRSTYKAYLEETPVFIKPPSGDFNIEKREPFYSSTAATKALVSAEKPFVLPKEILDQYNALSAEKKAIIDRLIGLDYIKNAHSDAEQETKDGAERKELDADEKVHVEVLARNFRGEALNKGQSDLLNNAFVFYNNVAKNRKATLNRLILSDVFVKRGGNYTLDFADVERNRKLTAEERNIREQIQRFRFQNQRIITKNQAIEALDFPQEEVETISLSKPTEEPISTPSEGPEVASNQFLIPLPNYQYKNSSEIIMTGKLLNRLGKIVPGRAVTLLKQDDSETSITGYTDNQGNFEFKLPSYQYKMVTEVRSKTATFSVSDFEVKSVDTSTTFQEASVAYFDTNSEELRSEAKKLLDEVVAEYKRNRMRIEVESHTDAVGNAEYNKQLSRRRGTAAFDYLVTKGVTKSDLSVVWHGFDQPIASNDSPYGRQLNRRMDIRMIGKSEITFAKSSYFLVRQGATLSSISRNLGVSVREIMETNGLANESIRPYQPLRIKSNKKLSVDQNLLFPANSANASDFIYVVKAGDSLESVSKKFNVPEELLMEINELQGTRLTPGMELQISSGRN